MKNALEKLPKVIRHKEKDYFLRVWVNAWGNICIGYKALGGDDIILSYVVEGGKAKYVPSIIEPDEHSGLNGHIGNCETLDECISEIAKKIEEMNFGKIDEPRMYFWAVKSENNFAVHVYSEIPLDECQVKLACINLGITQGDCEVTPMDYNRVRMCNRKAFFYSLGSNGMYAEDIWKRLK